MVAQRNLAQYYKVLLPERMHILQLTLQQYNGMLKGPYDLLLAKQSEVATEQAYVDAWRDYWIARADLERALGGRLPATTTALAPTTTPLQSPAPATAPAGQQENMREMHMPGMRMPGSQGVQP
jgi:cobalt-zinc-cadmium efflux system outer membrane protein